MRELKRILIANRGEIAVRIIRAVRESGLESVAIFSESDSGAAHTRLADLCVLLPGNSARDTYLNISAVLSAAKISGADAVHPGYGFFAENAAFAKAVNQLGMTFIGPRPETIELMGDKDRARKEAIANGVPVVPGTDAGAGQDEIAAFAKEVGYPIMIKAVAGGSGRGMRVVLNQDELPRMLSEAQAEGGTAFGNTTVIAEKLIQKPRHIEVQIFGDSQGEVIHLWERDCSVQRRQQKIIEEAPAPNLHPQVRQQMVEAAVRLAKGVGYLGAGTMEFLVEDGSTAKSKFYFLEMNTRIQVEHPVTECITGLDLVRLQLEIAAGKSLPIAQSEVKTRGHAFEFRVYAEDPTQQFRPATGEILWMSRPGGIGVREDGWAEAGTRISPYYDSLIAKLVVYGENRKEALERAKRALSEYVVEGVPSTLGFHRWFVAQPEMSAGGIDVKWIDREYQGQVLPALYVGPAALPEPLKATS